MGVTMKSHYERPGKSPHNPASFTPEPAPKAPPLRFLPRELIEQCATYREACALAWKHRTFPGMTVTYLGGVCDLYQQHLSDYFHPDERDEKGRIRRKLPAEKIGDVQAQIGNAAIAQWIARDMGMRLVEEFFAVENSR